ncbi:hypothetical protein VTK56DRAFT_4176 [Thermocarpiscus australiensis]
MMFTEYVEYSGSEKALPRVDFANEACRGATRVRCEAQVKNGGKGREEPTIYSGTGPGGANCEMSKKAQTTKWCLVRCRKWKVRTSRFPCKGLAPQGLHRYLRLF